MSPRRINSTKTFRNVKAVLTVDRTQFEAQKINSVTWYNDMLDRLKKEASNLMWEIIISDETGIYYYDPKTKQLSTVWIYRDKPKPIKVARNGNIGNVLMSPLSFPVSMGEGDQLQYDDSPSRLSLDDAVKKSPYLTNFNNIESPAPAEYHHIFLQAERDCTTSTF
ncbi:hypothetical protein EVAR_96986_1 [Eumeta japonica]|uniref:Mariner Mos1 transposase n=1 Tax=Eumeta variegata TaxID=151549 RepID=A0A4C1VFC2_EUMVA|nr:hypothetical protein EVAR_96986_1 [Eumeta japonica]